MTLVRARVAMTKRKNSVEKLRMRSGIEKVLPSSKYLLQ